MSDKDFSMRYSVRGKPQRFFDARGVDELLAVTMALAQELWAVRERQSAYESIAKSKGLALEDEAERHRFSASEREKLDAERAAFIDRIFFVLKEQAEGVRVADPAEPEAPSLQDESD